jgi:hypothetical protein
MAQEVFLSPNTLAREDGNLSKDKFVKFMKSFDKNKDVEVTEVRMLSIFDKNKD